MSTFAINAELGNCALCDNLCRAGDIIHAIIEEKPNKLLITPPIKCSPNRPIKLNATYEHDPQLETTIWLGRAWDFIKRKLKCHYATFCFHDEVCWAILLQTINQPPIRACYDITLAMNMRRDGRARRRRATPIPRAEPSVFYKPETIERGYQVYLSQFGRPRLHHLFSTISERDDDDDRANNILLSVRHLPYELRVHIWSYLSSSDHMARALIILLRVADITNLEDRHSRDPSSKIHLGNDLELSSYSFPTIEGSWLQCIHVEPLGIATCRGKIVIPLPGISTVELINNGSAIRFYTSGDDDTPTQWLGKVPARAEDCWYRFIHNNKEQTGLLYLKGKDRIEKIGFKDENNMVPSKEANAKKQFGSDFQWQPPLSRSEVYPEESYFDHATVDMYAASAQKGKDRNTQVRRVRFHRDGYRLHKITMFLAHGISGIECVFQCLATDLYETEFTGQRADNSTHLQLGQGEVITHVWVAREFQGFAFLQEEFHPGRMGLYLGTSFGRVKSFNDTEYRDIHCLTRQGHTHGLVTGTYWDTFYSYGVTFSGQEPQVYPRIPDPDPDPEKLSWKEAA